MAVVGALILVLTVYFVQAWGFMLLLGAAHSHDERIPALGFWASAFLVLALKVATITFNTETKEK